MKSKPTIETRPERAYVGIRTVMAMSDFETQIPTMTTAVTGWLEANDVRPTGTPFLRYHAIDMPRRMDVELGIPVAEAPAVSGEVREGRLPAGRYALLTYHGVEAGIPANKRLIEWIQEAREEVASSLSAYGEAFESRYETFLVGAAVEPDKSKWETEVALKLRD